MEPFPEEFEFLEFFGAEPRLTDPGVPWCYNCVAFTFDESGDRVAIELEPGDGILRVRWSQAGVARATLEFNNVSGLVLEREEGHDTLVARLGDPVDELELRLRLRPSVHVEWSDLA